MGKKSHLSLVRTGIPMDAEL